MWSSSKHFILSFGLFCGVIVFILTLLAYFIGYGAGILSLLSPLYIGYSVSLVGAIIGFFNALVTGIILAFILTSLSGIVDGLL